MNSFIKRLAISREVLVILSIIFVLALGVFVVLVIFENTTRASIPAQEGSTVSRTRQENPMDASKVTPRPTNVIILRSLDYDPSGRIARMVIILPDSLLSARININGEDVNGSLEKIGGENRLTTDLNDNVRSKDLSIEFFSGDSRTAVCLLSKREQVTTTGNCSW
jgi:hypothetical protein